ncbi:MAG: transcriptional regulator PpsR [Burkholderiales bacterium]
MSSSSSSRNEPARVAHAGESAPPLIPAGLDVRQVVKLIAATADITLLIDADGVIRSAEFGADFQREGFAPIVGRTWMETVTIESQPKVEALMDDAVNGEHRMSKWRQINHVVDGSGDVPVSYMALRANDSGMIIAVGRDQRGQAALQHKLVDAQHSLERDYWRLRNAETRYRQLFQLSNEALLVLDASTLRVLEANPAVMALFDTDRAPSVGQRFPSTELPLDAAAVEALLARVIASGRSDEVTMTVGAGFGGDSAERGNDLLVSVTPFRHDQQHLLMVRMSFTRVGPAESAEFRHAMAALRVAADGFAVATTSGVIVWANQTFADFLRVNDPDSLKGGSLERWVGRVEVDYDVLMSNLRQRGSVRLYATALRASDGGLIDVELSAVQVPGALPPMIAISARSIASRVSVGEAELTNQVAASAGAGGNPLARSADQLAALVGRMPLKDIVGETTELIEKLCIEASLQLSRDNRAAAAEMLGLSRQSFYVKMRRFGIGDLPGQDD